MPRLHISSTIFRRVASPSPGSLFFDTLRAGSGAVTIAKRSIYSLILPVQLASRQKAAQRGVCFFLILFLFVSI